MQLANEYVSRKSFRTRLGKFIYQGFVGGEISFLSNKLHVWSDLTWGYKRGLTVSWDLKYIPATVHNSTTCCRVYHAKIAMSPHALHRFFNIQLNLLIKAIEKLTFKLFEIWTSVFCIVGSIIVKINRHTGKWFCTDELTGSVILEFFVIIPRFNSHTKLSALYFAFVHWQVYMMTAK